MSVIRKPAEGSRSVLVINTEDGVAIRGDGPLTFVCGGCRAALVIGAYPGQIINMVLRCKACRAHNETLD